MSKTETVTFGKKAITIKPLKLGSLREIWNAVNTQTDNMVDRAAEIVKAGMRSQFSETEIEEVFDSGFSLDQLFGASDAFLRVSGLTKGVNTQGEAKAEAKV